MRSRPSSHWTHWASALRPSIGLFFSPGYTVLDLGAAVPVWHGVEVFGRLNNVTDRSYEEVLGFPALGRNGLVGVRVAAGR
jgi:outer membrane receptor protein involved in Fe transport